MPQTPSTVKPALTPQITIKELSNHYPQLVETLVLDYGFHCVGCFASEFETLEDGARVHGIVEQDFEELVTHLQQLTAESISLENSNSPSLEPGLIPDMPLQ